MEGKFSDMYFKQIFSLIPENLRPAERKTFQAYDGINNIFNLGYEALSWRVHRALINAKLEPYLGFLHSVQEGKPSLVCDFIELYRYPVDDFVIQYCQKLKTKDFTMKTEILSRKKTCKREFLDNSNTRDLMGKLDVFFESKADIARIKFGKKQSLGSLICEEASLFAQFLRGERETWIPRTIAKNRLEYLDNNRLTDS